MARLAMTWIDPADSVPRMPERLPIDDALERHPDWAAVQGEHGDALCSARSGHIVSPVSFENTSDVPHDDGRHVAVYRR